MLVETVIFLKVESVSLSASDGSYGFVRRTRGSQENALLYWRR